MRRKDTRIGKGGIHQTVWDNMRPDTRRIFNLVYPDDDDLRANFTVLSQHLVDHKSTIQKLTRFQAYFRHFVGYRVVALDGDRPNEDGLRARAQWDHPTVESIIYHLQWARFASPWISVFSSWTLALRRAKYFTHQCRATRVYIMAFDMEPIEASGIDAYQFALAYSLEKPLLYNKEVLLFNEIPQSCLLAVISAQECAPKTAPWLRLNVPEDLLDEARSTYAARLTAPRGSLYDELTRDFEAVRSWLFDSIWSRHAFKPHTKVERIMQSFAENELF